VFAPPIVGFTIVNIFSREFVRVIASSIIQEQKYTKTCAFCHWAQEILGCSKKMKGIDGTHMMMHTKQIEYAKHMIIGTEQKKYTEHMR
jgi:hypothetical protein